jgi:hypothetical protein
MLAAQEREARQLYAQLFEALQLSYQQADEVTRLLAERTMLTSSWSTGAVEHAALPEDHQLVREGMSRIEAIRLLIPGGLGKRRPRGAQSDSSLMRVSTAIQFTSQVLPPSSENACSKRHESGVMSDHTLRTRIALPSNSS